MQSVQHTIKRGFTLGEVLVSLLLVGVLATIMVPAINKGMSQTTQLNAVRTGATEVVQAYNKLTSDGTSTVTSFTTAQDIVDRMNYVRIIDDASEAQQTSIEDSGGVTTDTVCSDTFPCVLLQSGAFLQYNPQAVFGGTVTNTSGIRFIIDPDGSGSKKGTELILFYGPRITTAPLFEAQQAITGEAPFTPSVSTDGTTITGNVDGLPSANATGLSDPDYLEPWTE